MRKSYLPHLFAIGMCMSGLSLASCDAGGDNPKDVPAYDPAKPVELTSFHPTIGPLSTQVFLEGGNFGNNASEVKVWFNDKQASVISVKGKKMLVLAPKMPGEECVIAVKIGEDSVAYKDALFDYIIQTNVTTLVGGQQSTSNPPMVAGYIDISKVQFNRKPEAGLVIDGSDNIFVHVVGEANVNTNSRPVYMLNEKTGKAMFVNSADAMVGTTVLMYNPIEDNVYWMHTNIGANDLGYFDHTIDFANIRKANVTWDKPVTISGDMTPWGARQTIAFRPSDSLFYSRFNEGQFTRFNPQTTKGENISPSVENSPAGNGGDVKGMVFDPKNDTILYLANSSRHCIYKYNLKTMTNEVFAGQENSSGHVDGERLTAKFNSPCQMCVDADGNIYVADRYNHCIRRISAETGYVSTVAGVPGALGYVNGTADVAQFNQPIGLAIDSEGVFYIGDSENYAIRRLAIE